MHPLYQEVPQQDVDEAIAEVRSQLVDIERRIGRCWKGKE